MKKRKRHSAEHFVKKLRDADAMLASGKSVGEVLQSLEISKQPTADGAATRGSKMSPYGNSVICGLGCGYLDV